MALGTITAARRPCAAASSPFPKQTGSERDVIGAVGTVELNSSDVVAVVDKELENEDVVGVGTIDLEKDVKVVDGCVTVVTGTKMVQTSLPEQDEGEDERC